MSIQKEFFAELATRILVLDGAMGTMIQQYLFDEVDFRAQRFASHPVNLKGCNEILNLLKPEVILDIHHQYLNAGADIIKTNTFNSSTVSLADYKLEKHAYEINKSGATIARKACDEYLKENGKQCYVAGAIGPTNISLSCSNKKGLQSFDLDELINAYVEQISALVDGGVDLLLIETVIDLLNAKAALAAAKAVMKGKNIVLPLMISVSIADMFGHILSGQTLKAFVSSVKQAALLSIGLNCSFGAESLSPFLKELSEISNLAISVYPNAGLPDELGNYSEQAIYFASIIRKWAEDGILNMVGGCCGTNPDYIREISKVVKGLPPRILTSKNKII